MTVGEVLRDIGLCAARREAGLPPLPKHEEMAKAMDRIEAMYQRWLEQRPTDPPT